VKIKEALHYAEASLSAEEIEEARLEAEILLEYALKIDKVNLYLQLEQAISPSDFDQFWQLVSRRFHHEPLAYILKQYQFYGFDFYLEQGVFIPRPETELLAEEAVKFAQQYFPMGRNLSLADVGTGSGVIAITLALLLPQAEVYAMDISPTALRCAAINCQRHQVSQRVQLLLGNLLSPLPQPVNIVVANLPYISDKELNSLSPEIREFEPHSALAGGADGLDKIRQLLPQVKEMLRLPGLIVLEIGLGQESAVSDLAKEFFPNAEVNTLADLSGIARAVEIIFTTYIPDLGEGQ
jgi:release factor glutamine methyltransferase